MGIVREEGMSAVISVARCPDYRADAVRDAVSRAVGHFGGMEALIKRGDRVLLKPNLIRAAHPDMAVTTHPALVEAVAEMVKEAGGRPFIGDSPAFGSLKSVARAAGLLGVAERCGLELVELNDPVKAARNGGVGREFYMIDKAALEADVIINLPKVKGHQQAYLTAGVKNMFGCVSGKRKVWWHFKVGEDDDRFARMLVEVYDILRPALTIADAVVAMEGNGPGNGNPRQVGLIFAGVDCVAMDRVICHVLGYDPARLITLSAAAGMGIGEADLDNIRVLGEDLDAIRLTDFAEPRLIPIGLSLPRVAKSVLRNLWLIRMKEKRTNPTV